MLHTSKQMNGEWMYDAVHCTNVDMYGIFSHLIRR